ncbi:MAG TPA: FAD-dependent oxidoreductase, partial [Dongiaceae bacterium]|nr:FAD-dependent oxidoreductase [Dongiaceae bacterium]
MTAPTPISGQNRLPAPRGLLIDRSQPVTFSFEGRSFTGYAGDTIASALAANDAWMISRSFKYHRPRGILTMIGQDANTLVQVGDEPNCLADKREIAAGMEAEGQNYFGTLDADRGRMVELVKKFLPVGFYYKTFHEKRASWRFWEPIVRTLAGLGKIDLKADFHHSYYDKKYLFADVAVIGGGPAGLAAALQAAETGAEVILIEENPILGGSLNYARFDETGEQACQVTGDLVARVKLKSNITVMTRAICSGWFADNWLPVIQGNRLHKLRARAVVIATGSIEQPAVFRNNDLPGIMMGSAAQRLIHLYGVKPGQRAVILTANRDGYGQALDLLEAGVEVAAVIDLRAEPPQDAITKAVQRAGIAVHAGHAISEASYINARRHVSAVTIAPIVGEGELGQADTEIACDLVLMSVGYSPAAHLLHHAGTKFGYDGQAHMFRPESLPAHVFAAGSVNNAFDLEAVMADGRHAGWAAAKDSGFEQGAEPQLPVDRGAENQTHPWPIFPHAKGMEFVDFDEDLKIEDLING